MPTPLPPGTSSWKLRYAGRGIAQFPYGRCYQLASLLRFDGDPFTRELQGNPMAATDWDMMGARNTIDNARSLQAWVTEMFGWIVQSGFPAPVGPTDNGGPNDGASKPTPEPDDGTTNNGPQLSLRDRNFLNLCTSQTGSLSGCNKSE